MNIVKSKKIWLSLLILGGFSVLQLAFADAGGATDIGGMAKEMTSSFGSIGSLFIAAAYIAGFALTVAAIFKFKAHKDNPQQVPLGTAIALLVIGVLLVFLPALFKPAGSTIFGGTPVSAGSTGDITKLPGEE